jgi:hypothetical protein
MLDGFNRLNRFSNDAFNVEGSFAKNCSFLFTEIDFRGRNAGEGVREGLVFAILQ